MRSDYKQLAKRHHSPSNRRTKRKKRRAFGCIGCGVMLGGLVMIGLLIVFALGQWRQTSQENLIEQQRQEFFDSLGLKSQELYQKTNLLPSILLAQAALESDFGTSELSATYHNLFGVKAGPNEPSARLQTKEYLNGEWVDIEADFRVYESNEESLEAHANLLLYGTSWNAQQYHAVMAGNTPEEQATALGASGYATDPNYTAKILQLIDQYQLTTYDPPFEMTTINE
ncbi:glycoside hydrolase family 73 protein [Atopobacter phocae]|uniref:glycoside hydrolase family 73 protein n=1 Tax=Atopobacter phocae TaxID=136492 RepID=UPI0009FF057C|nr:glycoside hydrolase family 73 protein [Atopobacter phocae]